MIEMISCFSSEEADKIFEKLGIRGKVFVNYQIGVYRIILPTRPHEICTSEAWLSLSRGADSVGIRRLILFAGNSRSESCDSTSDPYKPLDDTNVLKSGKKTQKLKNVFTRSQTRELYQPLER